MSNKWMPPLIIANILTVVMAIAIDRLDDAIEEVRQENKCLAEHIAAGVPRADIEGCLTHD